MIVVDTSILVELFSVPQSSAAQSHRDAAARLMRQVESDSVEAILPEVVLHECYYVLVMRLRVLDNDEFCTAFGSILDFSGWRMAERDLFVYRRAIEILRDHPRLEFSDAVIATRAEAYDAQIATFDRHLLDIYDGPRWQPTADAE